MKIAIIYTTAGGTTLECADLLKRELSGHDVSVFDMKDEPSLSGYDTVVIGFPIRAGKPSRTARRYIKAHKEELSSCRAAYFMCCGFIDCAEEYAEKLSKSSPYSDALCITCLGGSLDPARFRGVDKMIVKWVRGEILGGGENGDGRDDMSLPTVLDENIVQMADVIKKVRN